MTVGLEELQAMASIQLEMSSCSKLRKLSVVSCGYEIIKSVWRQDTAQSCRGA